MEPGMVRQCAALVALILALLTVTSSIGEASLAQHSDAQMVRLPGHVLAALSRAKLLPPTNARAAAAEAKQPLLLTIVLKRSNQAGFNRYLHDVYDPHSPIFHRFLTPEQVSDRFGPSRAAYNAVLNYLRKNGFKVVDGSVNRLTLAVRGTRAEAEKAFGVHIRNFQLGGRRFFANDGDPATPRSVATQIEAVSGLSDLAVPKTAVGAFTENAGLGAFVADIEAELDALFGDLEFLAEKLDSLKGAQFVSNAFRKARVPSALFQGTARNYVSVVEEIVNLTKFLEGLTSGAISATAVTPTPSLPGVRQKIGLVAFSSIRMSDVSDWLALAGLPASLIGHVSQVDVAGGAPLGPDQTDVLLAVDTILILAPGAQITVYDTAFTQAGTSFQALFNQMINDGVNVIGNTFNYCEDQTTDADVDSLDAVLATAAASGISVLNATGDAGSRCNDGSVNTMAVPADSPHATAVGATAVKLGPGAVYEGESWWDGSTKVPPTGQSGFGVSRFFSRPAYQDAVSTAAMRSIPDVVVVGDPRLRETICEADAGGCPTGLTYGGTSLATAVWTALTADLNQLIGHPAGFLNPLLYPLAGANGFHSAASMGTDFAHVGLGSPNLDALSLELQGLSPGPPSDSVSTVTTDDGIIPLDPLFFGDVPADGKSTATTAVTLLDANGNIVPGKTVTLSASAGSHAVISPSSGVTSSAQGLVTFAVSDATVEDVTFTATDATDGITLTQTASVNFTGPAAASGGIIANPTSVSANGTAASTITVTLKDANGNPARGKQVTLSQGSGNSVITAPSPAVTDSNGQVQFTATDMQTENVTYTATDLTDGFLPVPGSVTVDYFSGTGCAAGIPPAVNGYTVNTFATGFVAQSGDIGFKFNCLGAYGMAFDPSGNLWITDWPTGELYKFGPSGGVADASTLVSTPGAPATGVAFDAAGNLFVSRGSTSGTPAGDVIQVNPSTGAIIREVANNFECGSNLAVDPTGTSLFVDDFCSPGTGGLTDIWKITGIDPPNTPTTTTYANTPSDGNNFEISFAPNGTAYVSSNGSVVRVSTDSPPVVTTLTGIAPPGLPVVAVGAQADGDAQSLILDEPVQDGFDAGTQVVDLTGSTPAPSALLIGPPSAGAGYLNRKIVGPDGCLYEASGGAVYKITNIDGTCTFGQTKPLSLSLSPTSVSPNPPLGTPESFTANFHYGSVPAGTLVTLTVIGPNLQVLPSRTDANGQAIFRYAGTFTGTDTLVASATVGTQTMSSNVVNITWASGPHTTFLNLNLSAKGGTAGRSQTVTASLFDVSAIPPVAVPSASVKLSLSDSLSPNSCAAITNTTGNASCTLTPSGTGIQTLTANFFGTSNLLPSQATAGFNVTAPTPTPSPSPIATISGTPTPTAPGTTPTATAGISSPTPSTIAPTATPTVEPTATSSGPTPTPTPLACIATTPGPTVPMPTPTPAPGNPVITSMSEPVLVGGNLVINGRNFSAKPLVNFFVATSTGPINAGPLTPSSVSATKLVVPIPATVPLGEGFVSAEVIDTDTGYTVSNLGYALLQGSAAAGLPTIFTVDGKGLAATSIDPSYATANVETTLAQGSAVTLAGSGFDTTNGVAVDVFCACIGGKLPTTFIDAGSPDLTSTTITFTLPAGTPTGPGSIIVSNAGALHSYAAKSEAVSVPIGARLSITSISQSGGTITVDGSGFSTLTVINLFNTQPGGVVNLGGFGAGGVARIPLTIVSSTRFTFSKPAVAVAGASFIQALNPPFVPFTSTGNDPCAGFTLE
jgi:hypothetical protein